VNEIILLRKRISQDVFDYQVLIDALSDYRKPRGKRTKLFENEIIIRIKKGLYCFTEDFRKEPVSREYLTNLIYGPCLSDDLRLDPDAFDKLAFPRLEKIRQAYDSAKIDNLLRHMTRERRFAHV